MCRCKQCGKQNTAPGWLICGGCQKKNTEYQQDCILLSRALRHEFDVRPPVRDERPHEHRVPQPQRRRKNKKDGK
jgi:hypothetical protein